VRPTAEQILGLLGKAGVSLSLDETCEGLIACPTELVTPDVIELVKEYKADIVAHFRDDGLGLVAKWSREFGYVSIHDPISGKWHDLPTKDAPGWALNEARRRKQLWRAGRRDAYTMNAAEMEEIWQAEHPPDPGFIVEDHPLPDQERCATG
jgi:hypothetical protein